MRYSYARPQARLVSHSAPAEGILLAPEEVLAAPEALIAYCARVSNPGNQHNHLSAPRLLRYLAKHAHWSPFEMVSVCLEVETTRDIARQLLRHRSFSFQEWSQRYSSVAGADGSIPFQLREARLQDTANRQNSLANGDPELEREWAAKQTEAARVAEAAYRWALERGIAKEVARSTLPEGLTPSRLYINGTIRSWLHYAQVRLDPSTQKEHRQLARACGQVIAPLLPSLFGPLLNDADS